MSKCRMYNRSLVRTGYHHLILLLDHIMISLYPYSKPSSESDLFLQEDLESLETIPCANGWTYNLTGLFTSAVTEVSIFNLKLLKYITYCF